MSADGKNVLDIENIQEAFSAIVLRIEKLDVGFRAVYAHYAHHIEAPWGQKHGILNLKDNIEYRLFSSKFHLELLLNQHLKIKNRIEKEYQQDPQKLLQHVYPKHPLFAYCEKEITSILDSIVFHLASIYDYFSAIINFICNKKNNTITKWSQLISSCRDTKNLYHSKSIAKVLINENEAFVDKLYKYRSRVLHEKSELNDIVIRLKLASAIATIKFLTNDSLTKNFSALRTIAKDNDITVTYVADWLIHSSIQSIARILLAIKDEIEKVSTFPDHIGDKQMISLYYDKNVGHAEPASTPLWAEFKTYFQL